MLVHGLFCSGLASVLYAKGIARTNAFAANLVCMSEVVLAPCWSALLFGEVFRWNEFLGAAMIVLVIVANLASDAFGDGFLVTLVLPRSKELRLTGYVCPVYGKKHSAERVVLNSKNLHTYNWYQIICAWHGC